MISNPNHIYYACIANGPTIVAEFTNSGEDPITETIAQQCVERTPPHHSMFSHTVRKKTYTFFIEDPFSYFAIFDECINKSESLSFLHRVKSAFGDLLASNSARDVEKVTPLCFQDPFCHVFREIIGLDWELVDSLGEEEKGSTNPSIDYTKEKAATVVRPLLAKPGSQVLMKKKKRFLGGCCVGGGEGGEVDGDRQVKEFDDGICKVNSDHRSNVGEHENENGVLSRGLSVSMGQKSSSGFYLGDARQTAKQIWRKHVWVVLIMDLIVCAVLFGIWLWVCRGFKCIDG